MKGRFTVMMLLTGVFVCQSALAMDERLIEKGKKIYLQCVMCHGVDGKTGVIGKPLAEQTRDELIRKIRAYRAGQIMGSTNATLMTFKARNLTDDDIKAVTAYIEAKLIKKH